jgi:hypothetical protein
MLPMLPILPIPFILSKNHSASAPSAPLRGSPNFSFQVSSFSFQPFSFQRFSLCLVPISTKSVMIQTPLQPPLSAQLSQKTMYLYDKLSQLAVHEQLTTKNRSRKLSLIKPD